MLSHKFTKKIGFLLIISFGLLSAFLPISQGSRTDALDQKRKELDRVEEEFLEYRGFLQDEFSLKEKSGAERIAEIRNQIESELLQFDVSKRASEQSEKKLAAIRDQIGTLTGQIIALEISMDVTKNELNAIRSQIAKRIADLQFLNEESDRLDTEIEIQKKVITSFFRLLQFEDEEFGVSDEARNILHILLSDESFSHNYWQQQQIMALDDIGREMLHGFESYEQELAELKKIVSEENAELGLLHSQRSKEEERLEQQMLSKNILKKNAELSEEKFKELLRESEEQMRESALLITQFQENKELVREKMDILEKEYRSNRVEVAEKRKKELLTEEEMYATGESFLKENLEQTEFSWPVYPKKGISAYYLDKDYEDVFHVQHHGVDIPTPQDSDVFAPALGYVYKVSDNGMGYSSVILVHRKNLMTVYGHVSDIFVEEGQLVHEGDVIALSGGMPGTKGAGLMTTGPHLHFEVFQDGKHEDPMDYLPMADLPREFIPAKYLKN